MAEDKPFCISKWAVLEAWTKVRANRGAAGIDDVSVYQFEKKLKNNLYTHQYGGDEAAALDVLPDLSAPVVEQAKTTGTDD